MKTGLVGGYPRPMEAIQAVRDFDKGKISPEDLEKAYVEATARVIAEQEEAGLGLVSDGCVRWDDPFTFFAQGLEGFELNGLQRFFDNNFYYRAPVAKQKIQWKKPVLSAFFSEAKKTAKSKLSAACPGPFSLAKLSIDEYYGKFDEYVYDLASAVNHELKGLSRAGADFVQLDEPCLVYQEVSKEELELAKEAISIATKGVSVEVMLSTYFGSVENAYPSLLDFDVDWLGIDFVSADNKLILEGFSFSKKLGFGVVDARNTRLEDPGELAKEIRWAVELCGEKNILVKPNFGFDLLPHERVGAIMKNMVSAVERV